MAERRKTPAVKTINVSPYQRTYTLTEKVCPVCGKTFTGTAKAKYDTNACRQKDNYARNGEHYRAQKLKKYQAGKKKEC